MTACIEVYSSESSSLTQCVKGCNFTRDKGSQGKATIKQKLHSKGKMEGKKVTSEHKVSHDGGKKKKEKENDSPHFPSISNFILRPVQLHYLFNSKSVVDDSKEQLTGDGEESKDTLIDSPGKPLQSELLPFPMSQNALPKSNLPFDSIRVLNESPMVNKRPLEPIDVIHRLFSKSFLLPQSTFHFIKSTITYVTDEGNDSNDTNQKPSPIPVEDSLSQFKTTDSVYSDPSELNIMEPKIIMFGETDQEPFQDFHGVTHVYKSPNRTTLYKIWECLKASLTMKHLRFSISLIVLSFGIVCLFTLTVMLYNTKVPRSLYSRVPVSIRMLFKTEQLFFHFYSNFQLFL